MFKKGSGEFQEVQERFKSSRVQEFKKVRRRRPGTVQDSFGRGSGVSGRGSKASRMGLARFLERVREDVAWPLVVRNQRSCYHVRISENVQRKG